MGFSNPFCPLLELRTRITALERVLIELLYSEYSMGEAKAAVNRLRTSQPLIFAGLISSLKIHDANSLLGDANLALEQLSKQFIGEPQKEEIDSVRQKISESQDLCEDVMKFSDKDRFKVEEVSLKPVVERVLTTYSKKIQTASISVELNIDESISLIADNDAIFQVIANLISNSIFFLARDVENKKRSIRIDVESSSKDCIIHVMDNGPGIPSSDVERIFDFLYTTKKKEGTGVGLSVTREIVQYYNGNIQCLATRRRGASFLITLPI